MRRPKIKKKMGVTILVQDIWGVKLLLTFGGFPCFLENGFAFQGVRNVKFIKNYMTKFRTNICAFYVCVPENRNIIVEIVACKRMAHKSLTLSIDLLLISTKKHGCHDIRLEDISEQTLQMHHVLPPLFLFSPLIPSYQTMLSISGS